MKFRYVFFAIFLLIPQIGSSSDQLREEIGNDEIRTVKNIDNFLEFNQPRLEIDEKEYFIIEKRKVNLLWTISEADRAIFLRLPLL